MVVTLVLFFEGVSSSNRSLTSNFIEEAMKPLMFHELHKSPSSNELVTFRSCASIGENVAYVFIERSKYLYLCSCELMF